MQKVAVNKFSGGRNADVDKSLLQPNIYLEGKNIVLNGSGTFLTAENIAGTLELATLYNGDLDNVVGAFPTKYSISGSDTNCITVFTVEKSAGIPARLQILCYDTVNSVVYELFQQTYPSTAFTGMSISAFLYPENSLDILYFTDGYEEIRKLRCEIPGSYTPNFLTESDLSLLRRMPSGYTNLEQVTQGGSLLCGTYTVTHRLIDTATNTYSRWAPFSPPIHINPKSTTSAKGAFNSNSTQKITFRVRVTSDENSSYSHYQLGVIEKNSASTGVALSLLPVETLPGSTSFTVDWLDNSKVDSIGLSDVVIDDLAIKNSKTVQVKNNKLFAGNLEYHDLSSINASVTAGSIVSAFDVSNKEFFNEPTNSKKKGYFRDEVYRFGIVYFDKYGNYSSAYPLNMNNVTGNQSTQSGFKDMKFPPRTNQSYHVFDSSGDYLRSLGLSFTVDTHPTWATGFVIVRAERKKDIVAQTPLLDCSELNGIGAVGEYPTRAIDGTSGGAEKDYTSAQPMSQLGTLAPKNLFWVQRRHIIKDYSDSNPFQIGEVYWQSDTGASAFGNIGSPNKYGCVFLGDMYSGASSSNQTYNWEIVDYAWLRLKKSDSTPGSFDSGDTKDTFVHGTFYADKRTDYYYSSNTYSGSYPTVHSSGKITEYKFMDNLSSTTIGGYFFQNYGNLITSGFTDYIQPQGMRMGVVKFSANRSLGIDIYPVGGSVGTLNAPSGQIIPSLFFENSSERLNKFCYERTSYTEASQYANIVEIINITKGLSDDRYGANDTLQDYISTGSVYNFSSSELATVQAGSSTPITLEVWGGDCIVSMHSFKITDSYFGVADQQKHTSEADDSEATIVSKWGRSFDNKHNQPIMYPVPYDTCSTVLSVVLESEYNGGVTAISPMGDVTGQGGMYVPYGTDKGSYKIPFTYGTNQYYSVGNNERIFLPRYDGQLNVTKYPARGAFSDVKVYQTGINGFDRIRIGNIFDLEETYGGITQFILQQDDLIAFQERAIAYIPVDANLIETTDSSQLSIRSSNAVDRSVYISRLYGVTPQNRRSVITVDNLVFAYDEYNRAVLRLQDKSIRVISDKGSASIFRNAFINLTTRDSEMIFGYDNILRQLWCFSRDVDKDGFSFCEIWDERFGFWTGSYTFPSSKLLSIVNSGKKLYLIGLDGTTTKIYRMYEGNYNSLLAQTVTPSIKFSVNNDFETPKTFDNFVVYSSAKMDTVDIVAERETGDTGFEVSGIDIDIDRREGAYRVQIPYDSNGQRVRGVRADVTVKWPTTNTKVILSEVATKYRISQRAI